MSSMATDIPTLRRAYVDFVRSGDTEAAQLCLENLQLVTRFKLPADEELRFFALGIGEIVSKADEDWFLEWSDDEGKDDVCWGRVLRLSDELKIAEVALTEGSIEVFVEGDEPHPMGDPIDEEVFATVPLADPEMGTKLTGILCMVARACTVKNAVRFEAWEDDPRSDLV